MLVSTTNEIVGCRLLRHVGLVRGATLRSRSEPRLRRPTEAQSEREAARHFQLAEDAREAALQRLIGEAKVAGANAVIGVRFGASGITDDYAEVIAYGTAVVVETPGLERPITESFRPEPTMIERDLMARTRIGEKVWA